MTRSLPLAVALLVGAAGCAGSDTTSGQAKKQESRPQVTIPLPLPRPESAGVELPRGPEMPSDTVSLEDQHREGKTDVVR